MVSGGGGDLPAMRSDLSLPASMTWRNSARTEPNPCPDLLLVLYVSMAVRREKKKPITMSTNGLDMSSRQGTSLLLHIFCCSQLVYFLFVIPRS